MYRFGRYIKIACIVMALVIMSDVGVYAQVTDFTPVVIDEEAQNGDIPDGVWYGPLDLSGMSYEEARKSIILYVMSLQEQKITLIGADGDKTIKTAGELGLKWNDEEALLDAVTLGKSGNVVSRFKELKDLERDNKKYDLKISFDNDILKNIVGELSSKYNVEPTETTMVKNEELEEKKKKKKKDEETETEEELFIISEGNTGYKLDENQTMANIKDALTDWDGSEKAIELAINIEEPKGKKSELMQVKDIIGTFTTKYGASSSDRTENLKTGVSHINGTILYPGEEFSTYEKVSPFTEENGYFLAGSYLNGTVVETFGGGICQVSTTLYNAVLLAELEVTERHNHSMVVNYVDISGDAAISGTEKDFKFKNNRDFPIYIEGSVKDKRLTFNIYGIETRPENRTVELESIETGRLQPEERVIEDPTKPIGYIATSSGHIGYSGEYWRVIKVDGKETERERVNVSNYQATPITIVKGTALIDPMLLQEATDIQPATE